MSGLWGRSTSLGQQSLIAGVGLLLSMSIGTFLERLGVCVLPVQESDLRTKDHKTSFWFILFLMIFSIVLFIQVICPASF